MWPWEHLAVGYTAWSVVLRAVSSRSPTDAEAAMAALGTQFPDLVDKPLSWTFRVLPSGTSLAHSVFFAVPFSVLIGVLARRRGRGSAGIAFAVGYVSHLLGDATYGLVYGRSVDFDSLLWPVLPATPARPYGFTAHFLRYLSRHVSFLATPRGVVYLAGEGIFLAVTVALWVADGCPGRPDLQFPRRERA